MKISLLIFIILMLMLSFLLFGCDNKGNPAATDPLSGETTAETQGEKRDALVFSDGKLHYSLVRPEKSSQIETDQFRTLRDKLTSLSGGTPILTTDEEYAGHKYSADELEILMGQVWYPECQTLLSEIAYNEYAIGVVGNKLVITAWADTALPSAVSAFISYAEKNTVNGILALPSDFRLVKTLSAPLLKPLAGVPAFPGGDVLAISDCADGFTQITINETTEAMFTDYLTILDGAGYTLYDENEMAENQFVTYTKSTQTIYAYYIPYSKTTRIITSVGALLPGTEKPVYTKVREASFTLFGLEIGGEAGGLGCMMQLEDGSFVIIDGGNNTSSEATQIYNKMTELAPDPSNIIIRAWIITHAHGDHYGAFYRFASSYGTSSKIKIESFIFNFCDTVEQTKYMSDGTASCTKVRNTMRGTYPKAKIYKSLTGQVFHFAGVDMEILNCMSDFLPGVIGLERSDADLTKADGNIQSIVVRFITTAKESQSVMVTGDVSKVSVDEMCRRFGDYLKSDMMTVPHHGWNEDRYRARNGTIEFYTFVDPTVVLWPDGVAAQAKKLLWNGVSGGDWEANYYLLNSLHVKKCIVAGSTTVTLTLPYNT